MDQATQRRVPPEKISPGFAARLDTLAPQEKVRAVLMLRTGPGRESSRRQSRGERRSTVAAVRSAADSALGEIDEILRRFDGRRLVEHASALGSVPVEATRAGIRALTESRHVKTILEDQKISLLRQH